MMEWVDKYDQLLDCNIGKGKKRRTLHFGVFLEEV